MKNLKALRQRQAELKQRGKALLDLAATENRDLTEAEDLELTQIEADLATLDSDIKAAEKDADRRRNFSFEPAAGALPALPAGRRNHVGDDRAALDPKSGFASIADFAMAVRRASPGPQNQGIDQRLMQAAVPSGTHRELGADGYLVPPEFRDTIWERILEQDNLIDRIDAEPTTSNVVNDMIDESTPWGSTGVKANWRSEATQMTPTRQNVKPRSIVLNELFAFVTATDELLDDAPRLENRLTIKAAEAITWKLDEAIFRGNGVGQPLGFMNAPSLIAVAKEGSQTADTLVAANVAKMFSRLLPEGIARSEWNINSDVIPQLMLMTLGDMPIWTPPASGFQNAPGGFLFGRPVRFSEHCKTLGDLGDVVLMDPKGYYGLRKEGVKYATSMHLYFDHGTTAFRWTFRFGGQPHLSAAVTPANGSATKGHFVALAERA